jgi:hypothetical protein
MVEQCLLNIIDAADSTDSDDVEIRGLLAAALRDSGLDLTRLMTDGFPTVRTSCSVGAAWRVSLVRSPSHRHRSPLVTGQNCRR